MVVLQLAMEVEGRPDVALDLTTDLSESKHTNIVIKEGIDYRMKVKFRVQNDVVAGLKYLQVVKRKGIKGIISIKISSGQNGRDDWKLWTI